MGRSEESMVFQRYSDTNHGHDLRGDTRHARASAMSFEKRFSAGCSVWIANQVSAPWLAGLQPWQEVDAGLSIS